MIDLETRLALEDDEPAVRELVAEHDATLQRDSDHPEVYWLTMHPRTAPHETFVARIAWTRYPHAAPSVKFADAMRGRLDVTSAWPVIRGYRPGSFDICQPFTAEGYIVHPDWVTGPEAWPNTGNPFAWVVAQLLHDMTDRYQGRSG
jgi:hypothetical protein